MKKALCLILTFCLLWGSSSLGEGALPPLEETIGRAMPSLGTVLQRYPDSESQNEDGSEINRYLHVTEEEFGNISTYLGQTGAELSDYQVSGGVMTAKILLNEAFFLLRYDSDQQLIEVTYPAGTYDERMKSARTHLQAARTLYAEGKEAQALKEIEKIPQSDAYGPARDPFAGMTPKEQQASASSGGGQKEGTGTQAGAVRAETPQDSESAENQAAGGKTTSAQGAAADKAATPVPAATPAPTATPEPTDEPYVLPEDADRSVELTAQSRTVGVGRKLKLKAEIKKIRDNAPNTSELTWTSEDPMTAAVSGDGEVTGKKPGSVRIIASLKDRPEIRAFVRVKVVQPVKSIQAASKSVTLLVGAAEEKSRGKISIRFEPVDATVRTCTYASSNEAVVRVDGDGNLQAVAPGKARITIQSAEEGSKAKTECNVTVSQAVRTISMPRTLTMDKKKSSALKAEARPKEAGIKTLGYTSSNPRVATVSNNGTVTAVSCGKATITAVATDGSGVSASCEVTVIQPVTRVSSKQNKIVLFQGQDKTWRPSVEPYDATNKKLRFSSDKTYVASVDQDGKISGKHGGKAKITATSTDGSKRTVTCNVVVEPSVPISLESIGYGIYAGNLFAITVKNECSTMTIVDIDFDLTFYDYSNHIVNSGSFSLGKEERVGPGAKRTIKRNVYGTSQAYKTIITLTGVKFADGTYRSIPSSEQKTWSFTR